MVEQRWSQAPLLTPHQNLACRLDALCGAAKRPLTVCGRWHRGRWQLASLAMERALTAAGESVVASPSAKAMSHPPLPPVRALPVARLDCCQGLLLCLGSSQGGQTRGRAGTRTAAGPRQRQRQGHIQRGDARRGRRFRRQRRRPQRGSCHRDGTRAAAGVAGGTGGAGGMRRSKGLRENNTTHTTICDQTGLPEGRRTQSSRRTR